MRDDHEGTSETKGRHMADITEIAVAAWRLEKWLDNVNVERKMAAKSALRSIKRYLQQNEIEVMDLTGSQFDVGLAVSVVNNESDETDEDKLIIREMVKPIIKERGAVIQYGQVILGDEVKKPKANNVVEDSPVNVAFEETIATAEGLEKQSLNNEPVEKDVQGTADTSAADPDTETVVIKRGPKKQYLVWISVFLLQLAIIILLGKTIRDIDTVKRFAEASEAKTEDNNSTPSFETNSLEATISNLDKRIGTVDSKIDVIDSSLRELSNYIIESSDSVLKERESDLAAQDDEDTENAKHSTDNYITYVVKSGDTLTRICSDHGINFFEYKKEILELNGITDPESIIIGQELKIPKE